MKKQILRFLGLILVCLFTFILTSCGEDKEGNEENDVNQEKLEIDASAYSDVVKISDFDISKVIIKYTSKSGVESEIACKNDYLSSDDIAKLATAGTHVITVSYEGLSNTFILVLKEDDPEVVTYTVTFKDDEGKTVKEEQVEANGAATAPEMDDKADGIGFVGWDKEFSCVTSDLIVTAKYALNAFSVTFVCENATITVYSDTDYTKEGTVSNIAYTLNKETFKYDKSGEGQVNFKVTPNEGYKIGSITIDGTYNNLKDSTDTLVDNVYRITKINSNLTVNIEILEDKEELKGYTVTFQESADYEIIIYANQDFTQEGTKAWTTIANDGEATPEIKMDGNDQVNFKINVLKKGFVVDQVTVEGGYNKLKTPTDLATDDAYRITKITANCTVTITLKEDTGEVDLGYVVTFSGEHVTVYVYPSKDYTQTATVQTQTSAVNDSGVIDTSGDGQVNFYIVVEEGYELDSVNVTSGTYKNLKSDNTDEQGHVVYRITKIQSALVVSITTKTK